MLISVCCIDLSVCTRAIFRIRKYPEKYENVSLRTPPRQLRMRLLHNTELYRVNSDYPSAQAFRYQNPTISVLFLAEYY